MFRSKSTGRSQVPQREALVPGRAYGLIDVTSLQPKGVVP
jgi:hypothetical protein